jgi:hypothetical protein
MPSSPFAFEAFLPRHQAPCVPLRTENIQQTFKTLRRVRSLESFLQLACLFF